MNRTTGNEKPTLAEKIQKSVESGEVSLPPLPELAQRLTKLLQDEDQADPRRVAALIRNDPAIAASVLRISNSASFAGLKRITDVTDAVARLGLRQVGGLVTAISHRGNFVSQDKQRSKLLHALWDHAIATALASKQLTEIGGGDSNEAFMAGLLHDTGKLVVLKGLDGIAAQPGGAPVTAVVAEELMTMLHTQLGHDVLVSWKISEPICHVALHHHDEDPDLGDLLLLRVQAANAISRKIGAHPHPHPDMNLLDQPAVERLNMGDLELATLMLDVEDQYTQVRGLF